MGQIMDKLKGKEWKERQIRKISDKVFNHLVNQSGRAQLTFEDLYIAVLLVYNDINKHLPGPHFDPPTKEQLKTLLEVCDTNLDSEINADEFHNFITRLSSDSVTVITQGMIITLVVTPTIAMATKKATEGVPVVGKVVQKLPTKIYASLVTLAILWFQNNTPHKLT